MTEESYEVTDTGFDLPGRNQALLKWEVVYDTVRPSQTLGYLTPLEYLEQHWQDKRKEKVPPIT